MTWSPAQQPIVTADAMANWRARCKARTLQAQRSRRKENRRIDYYPSHDAQAIIDARTGRFAGGDYSSVIDALVLADAQDIPE